jgi:hypothetical protein
MIALPKIVENNKVQGPTIPVSWKPIRAQELFGHFEAFLGDARGPHRSHTKTILTAKGAKDAKENQHVNHTFATLWQAAEHEGKPK